MEDTQTSIRKGLHHMTKCPQLHHHSPCSPEPVMNMFTVLDKPLITRSPFCPILHYIIKSSYKAQIYITKIIDLSNIPPVQHSWECHKLYAKGHLPAIRKNQPFFRTSPCRVQRIRNIIIIYVREILVFILCFLLWPLRNKLIQQSKPYPSRLIEPLQTHWRHAIRDMRIKSW